MGERGLVVYTLVHRPSSVSDQETYEAYKLLSQGVSAADLPIWNFYEPTLDVVGRGPVVSRLMAVEVWWRNPDLYIKEIVELHETRIAWDRGLLVKKNIEPNRFADSYFPPVLHYRMLAIGEQGAAELDRNHGMNRPRAVYPVWEYAADDIEILAELLAKPVGDDEAMCSDRTLPADVRPVYGQEHRVVVIRTPPANTGPGRKFLKILRSLQADYPDALIHLHGVYSYRVAFGMDVARAVDLDPRMAASKGRVYLPNGKEVTHERASLTPHWVTLVGYAPVDLRVPRNRCMFNMKAAKWAAEHFKENVKFRIRGAYDADPSAVVVPLPTGGGVQTSGKPAKVGDKIICDICSLQDTCKYFRAGAVCSLPRSESVELARQFGTRDSDTIIDGLHKLLEIGAKRLEMGLENEEIEGELDKEVTKALNTLFDRGVKLAKLINPALAVRANVNLNMNPKGVSEVDVRALTKQAVAALEEQGIARKDMTPQMIMRMLAPPEAIEAHVAERAANAS